MIRARLACTFRGFALHADFAIPAQGITAIYGPSASGKTTLLRCLAGLERSARGRVQVAERVWQDDEQGLFLATHRRGVGYVFQDGRLFEHLDVRGNLAFAFRRAPSREDAHWQRVLNWFDLGGLLARTPQHLSGGERQRVAIARAVLAAPHLLLLDEPLGALDDARRQELLPLLRGLHRDLGMRVLLVTHRMDEVAQLADQLLLLRDGEVLAHGPTMEILSRLDLPTAREEEAGVVVPARVVGRDEPYHLTELAFAGGTLRVAETPPAGEDLVRVRIRARDVSLARSNYPDSSILNRLPARVQEIGPAAHPAHVLVRLDAGGTPLLARITLRSSMELQLAPGREVWVQVKSAALLG